jgi:hypothetical protein
MYFWEARGSGVWLSLGSTRAYEGHADPGRIVAREAVARQLDTVQFPISGYFPAYKMENNRFEIAALAQSGAARTNASSHAAHLRYKDGPVTQAIMCPMRGGIAPYRAGWRHELPCVCDERLPIVNCGATHFNQLVPKGTISHKHEVEASCRRWRKMYQTCMLKGPDDCSRQLEWLRDCTKSST